jgi:hypothetical protein
MATEIDWTPGEPPKEDGKVVYGHTWKPYRWKAYSPKSEQFRHGFKGRWQAMNEYSGWDNAPPPNEWATEEAIANRGTASPVNNIERLTADNEALEHKLWMVISHATGGSLSKRADTALSANDICVEISRHHNQVWEYAQERALAALSEKGKGL